MVSIFSPAQRKATKELSTKFVLEHSVDDLTFDTIVGGFEVGKMLHSLYTNATLSNADIKLREDLAGYGITYDVVLENTKKHRRQPDGSLDMSDINPFQPIIDPSEITPVRVKKRQPPKTEPIAETKDPVALSIQASESRGDQQRNGKTNRRKPTRTVNRPIQEMPGKAPKVSSITSIDGDQSITAPLTSLEKARITYCDWAIKVGIRGVSELYEQVSPKEGVKDSDLPQKAQLGKLKLDRSELIEVIGLLEKSGELERRGVHGYIPLGILDNQSRQAIAKARSL